MYHNWYELYTLAKQTQKDLHRRADEARLVNAARKMRKNAEQGRPAKAMIVVKTRVTLVLQPNEVVSIRARRRPYRIDCVAGRLWTTVSGSLADAMLVAGETMMYCKSGKIVVQALRTATVRIECLSEMRIAVGLLRGSSLVKGAGTVEFGSGSIDAARSGA